MVDEDKVSRPYRKTKGLNARATLESWEMQIYRQAAEQGLGSGTVDGR
jgi:hypothetical protein